MASKFVLTESPYLYEQIKLASFIPDIRSPHQDALSELDLVEGQDFSARDQQDFTSMVQAAENSFLKAQLTKLATLSGEVAGDANFKLQASKGRVYELKEPTALFQKFCALSRVREWLQRRIELGKRRVHFVVGIRTYFDAQTAASTGVSVKTEGDVRVPVGEMVSGGSAVTMGDTLDVGIQGARNTSSRSEEAFTAPGERIYAICYRRLKFGFHPFSKAQMPHLGQNSWVMTSKPTRASIRAEEDQGKTAEIVEASLIDISEKEVTTTKTVTTEDGPQTFVLVRTDQISVAGESSDDEA